MLLVSSESDHVAPLKSVYKIDNLSTSGSGDRWTPSEAQAPNG